jgi:DNA-binding response OmpR family regulator
MAKKVSVIGNDLVLNEKIIKALGGDYLIKFFKYEENLVEKLSDFDPDLIMIDIISIGGDYISLMDGINHSLLANKKVLVISQSKKIDNIIGSSPKIRNYITKPIDFDNLKRVIEEIITDKSKYIVVADDDSEFLDLIRIFFESNGYKAKYVSDSRKVIDTIKSVNPSLILLDLIMPYKDGFEIISEMMEDDNLKNIPIVVISAVEFNKFITKGGASGYPEYISRDLSVDMIKEIVDNILNYGYVEEIEKTKVLVADDQIELVILMKEFLEKNGFVVFTAMDGKEAIEKIYEFVPDVVVLDYDMPFKSGIEVSSEIKKNPVYSHIPIIIVTAKGDKETKIKGLLMGIDDYITKPVDNDELVARIRMIVKRNRQVLDSNPLSKLPGNPSIQARIEKAIERKEKFAVLYIDLNNFKAYNDVYGFECGDNVIKTLAKILVEIVMPNTSGSDFIGHIGGDDFIVITHPDKAEDIAKKIINNFNQIVPSFYNKEDRERGYIVAKDRLGNELKFPLLGVAIGIVHNLYRTITSYAQVSHIGSELKKACKANPHSSYLIDRRKD